MLPESKHRPVAARILVVEDEVLIRVALADELRRAGFSVVEAATADEALAYLQSAGQIELVLSDIHMPGSLNGLELAHRIRDDYPLLPVILTSGQGMPQSLGSIDRFIHKPYDGEHVAAVVLEVLGGRSGEEDG